MFGLVREGDDDIFLTMATRQSSLTQWSDTFKQHFEQSISELLQLLPGGMDVYTQQLNKTIQSGRIFVTQFTQECLEISEFIFTQRQRVNLLQRMFQNVAIQLIVPDSVQPASQRQFFRPTQSNQINQFQSLQPNSVQPSQTNPIPTPTSQPQPQPQQSPPVKEELITTYKFSNTLKAPNILLESPTVIKSQSDQGKIALVEPPFRKNKGVQEIFFKGATLYGVCHLSIVKNNGWDFTGDSLGHGVYVVQHQGFTWSHSDKKQNQQKSSFQFSERNTVSIRFDPETSRVTFTNHESSNQIELNVLLEDDQIYPCVWMYGQGEGAEII